MATPVPPAAARNVLLAACGGLLLLGVVGLVAVDDGGSTAAKTVASGATTTTPAGSDTSVAPVPGSDATAAGTGTTVTAPGTPTTPPATAATATTKAATATTTKAGATTTAPASGPTPGALVAPKPGGYAYQATTTDDAGKPSTASSTTKVEAAGTEGPATLQDITIVSQGPYGSISIKSRVAWGPGGAIVRTSHFSVAGQEFDCDWNPDWAQYGANLKVGATWKVDTSCSATINGIPVTIQQTGTRTVTGQKLDKAPTGEVPTWTISEDSTQTLTFGTNQSTTHTTGTEQLAPSLGVPTSTDQTFVASGQNGSTTKHVTQVLTATP